MTAPAEGALVRVPGCPVCQRMDAAMCAAGNGLRSAARARALAKFTVDVERRDRLIVSARRQHERSREAFADHLRTEHQIDVTAVTP